MTWLELIEELRKQPMWLLEKQVAIDWDDWEMERWAERIDCHFMSDGQRFDIKSLELMQLICPTNEFEGEWPSEPDEGYSMSLTVMPKFVRAQPYSVTLRRTARVKVMAESPEQAQRIGEALAGGESELACLVANDAMTRGDDEFWGVGADGFTVAELTEEECRKILDSINE